MKTIKRINIEKVKIGSFKNIKNTEFDVSPLGVIFKGKNGIGKSNTLNAIYWCLTGVDLANNSDNSSFVPKSLRNSDGLVVDVEVKLNVGKIRRTLTYTKRTLSEDIYINDLKTESSKVGEAEIDKMLGLLEYTFLEYTNKDFVMRRFALNPQYIFTLTPKAIRDVVIKRYSKCKPTKAIRDVLDNPFLLESVKGLSEKELSYLELVAIDNRLSSKIKNNKSQIDKLTTCDSVLKTLKQGTYEKALQQTNAALTVFQKENIEYDAKERIVAASILELEKIYAERAKKDHSIVNIDIFSTNSSGVSKSCLEINRNEIDIEQRSTSESIFDSMDLILEYFDAVGAEVILPMFIDKAESINYDYLHGICHTTQLLATEVIEQVIPQIEREDL